MAKRKLGFTIFKYLVYGALCLNVALFLRKELIASVHRYAGKDFTFEMLEGFTSTIDTSAWLVLLILFELETAIISPKKMEGRLQYIFRIIRGLCYAVIVYSFIGYFNNFLWLGNFVKNEITDLCSVVGQSWLKEVDEFITLSSNNCKQLFTGDYLLKHIDKNIYTDDVGFGLARRLAFTDVINSASWILVVVVLEIDVWLQFKNRFKGPIFTISKWAKNILYSILLMAAIHWGLKGEFLDFWDAFLWIVAFVFIEMNLFNWQKAENA